MRRWIPVLLLLTAALPGLAAAQPNCAPGQDYVGAARQNALAGDWTGAVDAFSCALTNEPSRYDALLGRMEARLLSGDYAGAAVDVGRLRDFARDVLTQALAQYEALMAQDAQAVQPRLYHVFVLWALADDQGVLREVDQILALDPNNALAYLLRGSSREYLGDTLTSSADFQQALNLGGENPAIYSLIGSTHVQTGAIVDAYLALDRALTLNPNDPRSRYFRGLAALDDRDFSAAIADFTAAIALDPASYDAFYDRGQAYALQGDYASAVTDFDNLLQLNPNFRRGYLQRGAVQEWQGNLTAAAPDLQRFVVLSTQVMLPPLTAAPGDNLVSIQSGDTAQLQLTLSAGQPVAIAAQSDSVDPLLVLLGPDGQTALAASDDPQPGQRMPRIATFSAPADGVYTLLVASADPGRADRGAIVVTITLL